MLESAAVHFPIPVISSEEEMITVNSGRESPESHIFMNQGSKAYWPVEIARDLCGFLPPA